MWVATDFYHKRQVWRHKNFLWIMISALYCYKKFNDLVKVSSSYIHYVFLCETSSSYEYANMLHFNSLSCWTQDVSCFTDLLYALTSHPCKEHTGPWSTFKLVPLGCTKFLVRWISGLAQPQSQWADPPYLHHTWRYHTGQYQGPPLLGPNMDLGLSWVYG